MTTDITNHLLFVYVAYAAISIALTVWLARTLFKNGEVFLEEVFADNPRLATSVNHLLVVGFYLLNLGYALLTLKWDGGNVITGMTTALETLGGKLGSLLLVLGGIHMGNLYLFHRIRQRGRIELAPPPVLPQLHHTNGAAYAARV